MRSSSSGIGSVSVPSKAPNDARSWEHETWRSTHRIDGEPLGDGGWGIVIPVIHLASGKRRALKQPLKDTPASAGRFQREIEVQRQLDHRNVMQILEHCSEFRWFTMPLAKRTLRQAARELSIDEIIFMTIQIARGLDAAHSNGVIHRDVKPNNILEYEADLAIEQRLWVIGDFGIVHRPSDQGTDLKTSRGLGTDGFMAPEVALGDGADVSIAADVYSLGRTIAWTLTGKIAENFAPTPVPWPWSPLITNMTEFQPGKRPQSMTEVISGILSMSAELRNARSRSWGTGATSELTTDDEEVLLAIVDNLMDPEDAESEPATSHGRLTSIFPSTALLWLSLRRLVERNYVRQGVYQHREYSDGPDVRTYTPTEHARRWLEDNLIRVRQRLLSEKSQPAEPVPLQANDDIPF